MHYRDMDQEQLEDMLDRLNEEIETLKRAERTPSVQSQLAILHKKWYVVRSYLIGPETITIGATYRVDGEDGLFTVKRLDGIMAWGHWLHPNTTDPAEEIAFPIGQLLSPRATRSPRS